MIAISVIVSYTNYQLSLKVQRNTNFLSTSETLIRNSTTLHKSIIEMQSGFRGFLLTGNSNYLGPFTERVQITTPLFAQQRELLAGSPRQLSRLDSIVKIHQEWLRYSTRLMTAKEDMLKRKDLTRQIVGQGVYKTIGFGGRFLPGRSRFLQHGGGRFLLSDFLINSHFTVRLRLYWHS